MIFKKDKSNSLRFESKIFWWKHNGKRKFEAAFITCFGYTFWLFRNEKVLNDWPSQS